MKLVAKLVVAGSVLGLAVSTVRAEVCKNTDLRMTITNISRQGEGGYVSNGTAAGFYIQPNETRTVTLRAKAEGRQQYKVQAVLSGTADGQCADWIELPSGCPADSPAAHMYLYKTTHGYNCFIRSVERLPKETTQSVALNASRGQPKRLSADY